MVYKNIVNACKVVFTQQQFQIGYDGNTDLTLVRHRCKIILVSQ